MPQTPDYLLTLTSAPATVPLSTADAKAHLRVDTTDDDALIDAYVLAATKTVEEMSGKQLITQTWEMLLRRPPYGAPLFLPKRPVVSVTSIEYYDEDNAEQTFSSANYLLHKDEDNAFVETVSGVAWPNVYDRRDAVTVTFVAGFGAASDVPTNLVQAIKMIVAHWYENREAVDEPLSEIPMGAEMLVGLSKTGWIAA